MNRVYSKPINCGLQSFFHGRSNNTVLGWDDEDVAGGLGNQAPVLGFRHFYGLKRRWVKGIDTFYERFDSSSGEELVSAQVVWVAAAAALEAAAFINCHCCCMCCCNCCCCSCRCWCRDSW